MMTALRSPLPCRTRRPVASEGWSSFHRSRRTCRRIDGRLPGRGRRSGSCQAGVPVQVAPEVVGHGLVGVLGEAVDVERAVRAADEMHCHGLVVLLLIGAGTAAKHADGQCQGQKRYTAFSWLDTSCPVGKNTGQSQLPCLLLCILLFLPLLP